MIAASATTWLFAVIGFVGVVIGGLLAFISNRLSQQSAEVRYVREAIRNDTYEFREEISKALTDQERSSVYSLNVLADLDDRIRQIAELSSPAETESDARDRQSGHRTDGGDLALYIREISHSLGTPLAQIKASALSLSSGDSENIAPVQSRILSAVDLANAYISAFRDVAGISEIAGLTSHTDLGVTLRSVVALFAANSPAKPSTSISVPSQLPGYSVPFVLALLGPLIENAFESVSPGGQVSVFGELVSEGYWVFEISNTYHGPTIEGRIFDPGYTSKPNHQGIGLSVVKRLLQSRSGADIHVKQVGDRVAFSIQIPAEVS